MIPAAADNRGAHDAVLHCTRCGRLVLARGVGSLQALGLIQGAVCSDCLRRALAP